MQPQSEMVILGTLVCPATGSLRRLTNSEDMALGYFANLEYGTDGRVSLLPFGKEFSHIAYMAVEKRKNQVEATTESTAFNTADNIAILDNEMPDMIPANEVRGSSCYSGGLSHCFRLALGHRLILFCPMSYAYAPYSISHSTKLMLKYAGERLAHIHGG